MKKALALLGILSLTITPRASFSDHLKIRESNIKARGNLYHANLRDAYLSNANLNRVNLSAADLSGADLSGAYLSGANLSGADMSDVKMTGISTIIVNGCPSSLPNGWICKNNTLSKL